MNQRDKNIFLVAALASLLCKIAIACFGYNYDLLSYEIVSKLVLNGQSVYAHTDRYNYGPLWFCVLAGVRWVVALISNDSLQVFHVLIAFLLGIVDIATGVVLYKRWGKVCALLFLLNPISIVISGYHSQFDSIAILLSLLAVEVLADTERSRLRVAVQAGLLLGVSLVTKHSFIFFPCWLCLYGLFFRKKEFIQAALIAVGLFLMSFVPWMLDADSRMGILNNVVFYSSRQSDTLLEQLLYIILPWSFFEHFLHFLGQKKIFLFILLSSGVIPLIKKLSIIDTWVLYVLILFCFSSGMCNQYLIFPLIPFCIFYRNKLWIPYFVISTLFLLFSPDGLAFLAEKYIDPTLISIHFFNVQFWALCLLLSFICSIPQTHYSKIPAEEFAR